MLYYTAQQYKYTLCFSFRHFRFLDTYPNSFSSITVVSNIEPDRKKLLQTQEKV